MSALPLGAFVDGTRPESTVRRGKRGVKVPIALGARNIAKFSTMRASSVGNVQHQPLTLDPQFACLLISSACAARLDGLTTQRQNHGLESLKPPQTRKLFELLHNSAQPRITGPLLISARAYDRFSPGDQPGSKWEEALFPFHSIDKRS
jgi:hypothetical protein